MLSIPQQTFSFSGAPTTNGATHWFLSDNAAKLYASGPLNPTAVTDTFTGALTAATSTTFTAATSAKAAQLAPGDWLWLGYASYSAGGGNAANAGNEERVKVLSVSGSVVTLTAAVANNHLANEPWSRDGVTRTYSAGVTEAVTPTIILGTATN